jgi:hypothetical protein
VEDNTLSTLIPLLPITKYFERRLGLSAVSGTDTETVKRSLEHAYFAGRPKIPGEEIKVSMEVKLEPTVYTLEEHLEVDKCTTSYAALELEPSDSGFTPKGAKVQLVSVEVSSDTKKDDDTAYSISGKIVPPKPAKTDAVNSATPPP